jgi:hypothetical protein
MYFFKFNLLVVNFNCYEIIQGYNKVLKEIIQQHLS